MGFVKTVLLEQLLVGKIIRKKAKEVQNVQLVLVVEITLKTLRLPPLLVGTRTQLRTAMQAVLVVDNRILLVGKDLLFPAVERIRLLVTFLLLLVAEQKQRMIDHWLLISKKVGVHLHQTEKVHSRQLQSVLYSKLDKSKQSLTVLRLMN